MGTSPETFNQVKDILKKLDRSIDDARNRRVSTGVTPPSQQMKPQGAGSSGSTGGHTPPSQPRPGRAKPMSRNDAPRTGFQPGSGGPPPTAMPGR